MLETRVAIIGAGPIGLELAIALKRMGVEYQQFDAGQIGQTITWYPRHTRFFSSPERIALAGVPLHNDDQSKATREQYLTYLRGLVEQFDLHVNTYQRVTDITRDPDTGGFTLTTDRRGQQRTCRAEHVVCTVGDMHGPRRLGVPGEDLPHVDHYFDDPHRYFRQKLLIVGGRNSAVEAALRCHRAGTQVSISYRRPGFDEKAIKYWLLPEIKSLIKHGHVGFHPCTVPTHIGPEHVTLGPSGHDDCASANPNEPIDVAADFVLLLTGYVMDPTLLEKAGVALVGENRAPDVDLKTMQTNVPRLYVAGTAAAGTQVRFRLFIENCHQHVTRIVRAITGESPPSGTVNPVAEQFELPES